MPPEPKWLRQQSFMKISKIIRHSHSTSVSIQPRTSPVKLACSQDRGCIAAIPVCCSGLSLSAAADAESRCTDVLVEASVGLSRACHGLVTGCGKLYRPRSRLYRNEILQENMRSKAPAEIYTTHSFAQLCNLNCLSKICQFVC